MIVLAVGVVGKLQLVLGEKMTGIVVEGDADDALCAVEQLSGVEALVLVVLHVGHAGVAAFVEPCTKSSGMRRADAFCSCHSACRETEVVGQRLECLYFK